MTDSFLRSMTFSRAREFLYACDCEDCEDIPLSIRKFIHDRKRQRRESGPIKRTQQRTLVSKRGPITLHSIYMPKHAEPLIDFGNSHRVVWVKRLVKQHRSKQGEDEGEGEGTHEERSGQKGQSVLQWIGKGIIGSSHEEKGRVDLCDWTEGSVIFIPSTGGKAVGWIHTNDKNGAADANSKDEDDSTRTANTETEPKATDQKTHPSDNFAILYVAKIPSSAIATKPRGESESEQKNKNNNNNNNRDWVDALIDCCRDGLEFCAEGKESGNGNGNDPPYHRFATSERTSELVKQAIRGVDGDGESGDAAVEPASKRVRWQQPEAEPESR